MTMKTGLTPVNYHLLKDSIVVNFKGTTVSLEKESDTGQKIIDLLRKGDNEAIIHYLTHGALLSRVNKKESDFDIVDGAIYSNGVLVESYIASRILELQELGLPIDPLLNFWKKVQKNPSRESKKDLFRFVEHNNFPITNDGNFIAYKKVGGDFKDLHTRQIDNSPGKIVEMNRKDVNGDRNQTCSRGLHVASYNYAKFDYGGRADSNHIMLEIEVDPMDVVSVPVDYGSQKCRTCRYIVLGVCNGEIKDNLVDSDELKDFHKTKVLPKDYGVRLRPTVEDPVKKRDDRSRKNIEDVKIGHTTYSLVIIPKSKFDIVLSTYKFKSICKYDRATYFLNMDSKKVYRAKVNDKLIYLVENTIDGETVYLQLDEK